MGKVRDLIGYKSGLFTVVSFCGMIRGVNGKTSATWKCRCECGSICTLSNDSIVAERKRSCGCLHELNKSLYYNTPTYKSWGAMKDRCSNKNCPMYDYYGGRGIGYDPTWQEFQMFLQDMGVRPTDTTLDRKDVNLGYSKDNCTWSSKCEQAFNQNKRKTNKSGKTGVVTSRNNKGWVAWIYSNRLRVHLGTFTTFRDAVNAREQAEIKYYGKLKGH